jgi:hypothetical protein
VFGTSATNFAAIARPTFGRISGQETAVPPPKSIKAQLRYQHAAKTAAELLPNLPEPGESIHVVMTGTFDLCQVLASVIGRLPHCRHIRIATLCYSRRNAVELLGLLESRPTLNVTLLVSDFFKGHNKELHEWFAEELREHSSARLAAARSHAKVVCFDIGPGDGLVFEGSANLRTNGNLEQLTAIRCRELHDWHAEWIDRMVNADAKGNAG